MTWRSARALATRLGAVALLLLLLTPPSAFANRSAVVEIFDCESVRNRGPIPRTYAQDAMGQPPSRFLNWHLSLLDPQVPHRIRLVGNRPYKLNSWQSSNASDWQGLTFEQPNPGPGGYIVNLENTGRWAKHILIQAVPLDQGAPMEITAYVGAGPCPRKADSPAPGPCTCPPGYRVYVSPGALGTSTTYCVDAAGRTASCR